MAKRSSDLLYTLPDVDTLAADKKNKLSALLREAHSLKEAEARLKAVRAEIVEMVQAEGLAAEGHLGARSGNLCCVVRWQQGRKTLDRALLVDAGVTPAQLDMGTKEGQGYWMCELATLEA
jgi:hypothetical protein